MSHQKDKKQKEENKSKGKEEANSESEDNSEDESSSGEEQEPEQIVPTPSKKSKKLNIDKILAEGFPLITAGKLTLPELLAKTQGRLTKDELRLRYLETEFPIVLEDGEEPTDEDYEKYYVVEDEGQELFYPFGEELTDENGKTYPIVLDKGVEATKKQKRKYHIISRKKRLYLFPKDTDLYNENEKRFPRRYKPEKEINRNKYLIASESISYYLYPRVQLYDYQKIPMEKAIDILSINDVVINASEMSLGKTLMTIYLIQQLGMDFRIVVICPSGPAETMWERSMKVYGLDVFHICSYRTLGGTWGKKYHCEQLLTRRERLTEGNKKKVDFELSEELAAIIKSDTRPLMLICDEIHHAKNKTTNATPAIFTIIKSIRTNDENYSRAVYLTGTVSDNIEKQAINYLNLLGILNTPHLYLSRGGFVEMTGAKQILSYGQYLDEQASDKAWNTELDRLEEEWGLTSVDGENEEQSGVNRELITNMVKGQASDEWRTEKERIEAHVGHPISENSLRESYNRVKVTLTNDTIRNSFTNNRTGIFDEYWSTHISKIKQIPELMLEHVFSKYLVVAAVKTETSTTIKPDVANFYLDVTSPEVKEALAENTKRIAALVEYDESTREAVQPKGTASMAELTRLIQARQVIKATLLGEYLKKRLEEMPNIKVIIPVDFNAPQEILREMLAEYKPIIWDGKTKSQLKAQGKLSSTIERFNTDPNERVWIGKTKAMSEVINLHDTSGNHPREMYVLPSLSALSLDQVMKRHDRADAMSIPVTRVVFVADEETEMYIFASLARKHRDIKRLLPDEAKKTRRSIRDLPNIYQTEMNRVIEENPYHTESEDEDSGEGSEE